MLGIVGTGRYRPTLAKNFRNDCLRLSINVIRLFYLATKIEINGNFINCEQPILESCPKFVVTLFAGNRSKSVERYWQMDQHAIDSSAASLEYGPNAQALVPHKPGRRQVVTRIFFVVD